MGRAIHPVSMVVVIGLTVGCGSPDDRDDESSGDSGGTPATGGTAPMLGGGGSGAGGSSAGGSGAVASGGGGAAPQGGTPATGGDGVGAVATGGASGGTLPGLDSCPAPPAGSPAEAVVALHTTNEVRLAMGVECQELIPELTAAAQNHCDYYALNEGDPNCEAGHNEVEGCPGFTGTGPWQRMAAAGYTGGGGSECMAFRGDPIPAVMMFVDSVYHRTPVLTPWMRHMGYGFATGCDTIDFGRGPNVPDDVVAHYPYTGQTGVPVQFRGDREGPEPPMPSTGWPSGYPVTLFIQGYTETAHRMLVDATGEELAHTWLDGSGTEGRDSRVLYADLPLEANTTYRVIIEGTRDGAPLNFDWTFTTGDAPTNPWQ